MYLAIAARIGVGFQRRLGDIGAAETYLRGAAVEEHVLAERSALAATLCQFKTYPEVDLFLGMFELSVKKHRRPMLAILGGTNLGESLLLAANILERLARALSVETYLEVTVEGNPNLDLTGFDHRAHSGVLLDGVGDAMFLRAHREVLQGRPKKCTGGQSATNVYAYSYTLARRGVVATFDLSAANLQAFREHHWLSDNRNVIELRLETPAFVEPVARDCSLPATHKQ